MAKRNPRKNSPPAASTAVEIIPPAASSEKESTPRKQSRMLKDMVMTALEMAGGENYLVYQAMVNPGPFLALVGKVIPIDVKMTGDVGVQIQYITRKSVPSPHKKK